MSAGLGRLDSQRMRTQFGDLLHRGRAVAWPQDYSYWTRTHPLAHLTCWIGLDGSTRENGCLQSIPGSSRWPDLPITGLAGDMEAIYAVLNAEQRRQFDAAVAVELKKGEASFHHPCLVHGSFANHSDRARRATVVNVMRDGVRSATNEPLLLELRSSETLNRHPGL